MTLAKRWFNRDLTSKVYPHTERVFITAVDLQHRYSNEAERAN